jgi:hypothetical protein
MGPLQKTVKTIEAPQNRRSYGKMESLPLRPTNIGVKGSTLGKNISDSSEVLLGTPLGNTLGT